ncbi:MAG: ATP-binding protein [Thermoplasmatales archaeon]|nr:ATP-binding protein [Thermoplasmatales archaeon]
MSAKIFKRKIYERLLEWKRRSNGTSALLVEGARRVGKSTVVEEFGKREYASYILIDFMRPKPGTLEIFESYGHDIGLLTSNLAILYGVTLKTRESLFIFDEVQKYPRARELIKYFVKDGRYDYLETGSLISIRENVKDIQIPSEEEAIQLNPMDFEEWLWANGDEGTMDRIRWHYENREPLGQTMHRVIMDKFRLYMITGGMPGSVSAFLANRQITDSESVKRQILRLYSEDMHKNRKNSLALTAIFDTIPGRLSARNKVFRPGTVSNGTLTADYEEAFDWLSESKIVSICVSNTDPGPAMNLHNDPGRFKVYLLDTGLLITLAFDVGAVDESVFVNLAKSKLGINEGMLFENMVAQALVSSGHRLYFHEFYRNGNGKNLYEVDFVLVKGNKIVPVEAKSSISSRHASLDAFMGKYGMRISEAIVVHQKDLRVDGKITYLPIYMAALL